MVQNMRAYFILHVTTIKFMCMQEMTEFSCTKTKVYLNQNCRRSLLGYEDKATKNNNKILQEILCGGKRWYPPAQQWQLPPTPPRSYGPVAKVLVSTSSRDIWVLGACPQKNFLKQLSLECQKIPFCVVGNHVCIIDFHPWMENMILPSNLYCANLKKLKISIFKEEIFW